MFLMGGRHTVLGPGISRQGLSGMVNGDGNFKGWHWVSVRDDNGFDREDCARMQSTKWRACARITRDAHCFGQKLKELRY